MNLFRSSKVEIDVAGLNSLNVSTSDHRLANKINAIVHKYPDYTLVKGEELYIRVDARLWAQVSPALPLTLAQAHSIKIRLEKGFQV